MSAVIKKVDNGTHAFWCPGCKCAHGFNAGWTFNGDFESPAVSPSILVRCDMANPAESTRCHLFMRDGQLQFLLDCTHGLAGKTVPMEPLWEDA
jgi:hypothetical protein